MTYAVQQDMEDRFGSQELVVLTDRDGNGVVDGPVLIAALADADAEIDGYLRGRYTLPLVVVPDSLTRVACVIARWRLVEALGHSHDVARQAYEDARSWLKDVAAGRAQLDLDQGGGSPVQSDGPDFEAPDRVFDSATLADF